MQRSAGFSGKEKEGLRKLRRKGGQMDGQTEE